ncbi:hypothetical protein ACA910_005487 [Epithemia clementina (nom. ined.)]
MASSVVFLSLIRKRKEYQVFLFLLSLYVILCIYSISKSQQHVLLLFGSSSSTFTNNSKGQKTSTLALWRTSSDSWTMTTSPDKALLPSLPNERAKRFPSVEERVKVYMGHWYLPPCGLSSSNDDPTSVEKEEKDHFVVFYKYNPENETVHLLIKDPDSDHKNENTKNNTNHSSQQATAAVYSYVLGSRPESRQPFFAKQSDFEFCNVTFQHDKRIHHECLDVHHTIPKAYLWQQRQQSGDDHPHNITLSSSSAIASTSHHQNNSTNRHVTDFFWNETHLHFNGQNSNGSYDYSNSHNLPPVLLRFGDESKAERIPIFQKWKPALTTEELERVTSGSCRHSRPSRRQPFDTHSLAASSFSSSLWPPIVWLLNSKRHYRFVKSVPNADTLWKHKKNMAIFRGGLTGFLDEYRTSSSDSQHKKDDQKYNIHLVDHSSSSSSANGTTTTTTNEEEDDNDTDGKKCQWYPRCRLVVLYANSSLVDAKLTSTKRRLSSNYVNGLNLLGPSLSLEQQLRYKGMIFLEGNDVSSGLKWGLLSRSVVLMPPPTKMTWAMEALLQPYVHYIPLYPNLTNVEEQVQWMIDHDQEAQAIAHQSSLWIQDLVLHPNATFDNRRIRYEILQRYQAHFRPMQA